MSDAPVLLSIIVPCYNVSATIGRALDSILFQKVNFRYEVLCVNDASTDDTADRIREYAGRYDWIHLLENPSNAGNAETFYNGLKAARGKYFAVLDGDDFYSLKTKLQKQVDFFENDVKGEFCAVTHYHIIYKDDGTVNVPDFNLGIDEYTYQNFLERKYQYHHTSAYMFRNIYKGNPPEIMKKDVMRGDHPRIFIELILTNKKVKVLPFFGSVYNYNFNGIWSSLNFEKQMERNKLFSNGILSIVNGAYEKLCMEKWKTNFEIKYKELTKDFDATPNTVTKDEILDKIASASSEIAFGNERFAFHSIYKSLVYDSLCASLGYIQMLELNLDVLAKPESDSNIILIVVKDLIPHGGGIFSEICQLASVFNDKTVYVLCTDKTVFEPDAVIQLYEAAKAKVITLPEKPESKLESLFRKVSEIKPERIYFYVGHNNPIINCLAQPALSNNIHVFSYDHGFVLGIENPNFNSFMVKRAVDFILLKRNGIHKVNFIPVWSNASKSLLTYIPFKNHNKIITATAAARWYKCEGSWPCSYLDLILKSLLRTGGHHIHYGNMPDTALQYVKDFLGRYDLPEDSFINIPWAEDLGNSLLENNVDLFIEPFPVVSAKISLIVQSVGVPILRYDGITRLSFADFVYDKAFTWKNTEEVFDILTSVSKETLEKHSIIAKENFIEVHAMETVRPYIYENKSFLLRKEPYFVDDSIQEYTLSTKRIFQAAKPAVKTQKAPAEPARKVLPAPQAKGIAAPQAAMPVQAVLPDNDPYKITRENFEKKFREWHPDFRFVKMKKIYLRIEYIRCKICLMLSKHKDEYRSKVKDIKSIMKNGGNIIFVEKKVEG